MKLRVAENIRKLRREKNITQEELADKLCVSTQIISRWETGVTYPDIELLPVVANYFEVTIDSLLGAMKAENDEAPQEMYDKLNVTTNHLERLALLRELHRDYPRDWAFLWNLCGETDDVEAQRKYTAELLAGCQDSAYTQRAIEWMINAETDEDCLKVFLDKHTTDGDRNRSNLLEGRYLYRKEYDKYEPLKQAHALHSLLDGVFPRLTSGYPEKVDIMTSLWSSKTSLEMINLLTGTSGRSIVTGDGIPDMWFVTRFELGTRYASQLAAIGRTEEALNTLEEITDLCDAYFSLPNKSKLSYRCTAFDCLEGTLNICYSRGPGAGEEWAKIKNITYSASVNNTAISETYHDLFQICWPCLMIMRLTCKNGWEWFDPIRNDPRFVKCTERLEKFVVTESVK